MLWHVTLSLRNGFKKSLAPHLRGLRALGISRSAGLKGFSDLRGLGSIGCASVHILPKKGDLPCAHLGGCQN